MNTVMPLTSAWSMRWSTSHAAPLGGGGIDRLGAVAGEASCRVEEAFGGVVAAGEHDVFAQLAQLGVDLVVHGELAGVDDAHPHSGFDGAQQEHRVHRFAHRLVAAERERQVRHTAGDVDVGQFVGDLLGGFEEVEAVAVVLFDAGGDREDVGVDDDVLGREPDLVDQQVVRPAGDVDLALDGVGLADFVEGHHDDRRAVVETGAGLVEELLLAFLHRDRVDDRLALHALQPASITSNFEESIMIGTFAMSGSDAIRLRNVVIASTPSIRPSSMLTSMICAPFSTCCERDFERLAVLVVLDQATELGRAGDVGALADVDERDVVGERERLETGEFEAGASRVGTSRGALASTDFGDRGDVRRRGAAATADDVEQAGLGELADERCGLGGCLVVAAELVRQAGVRIGTHERVGDRWPARAGAAASPRRRAHS